MTLRYYINSIISCQVSNLRDALDIHIKTINQQQLGNNHLENKIKDLQFYVSVLILACNLIEKSDKIFNFP